MSSSNRNIVQTAVVCPSKAKMIRQIFRNTAICVKKKPNPLEKDIKSVANSKKTKFSCAIEKIIDGAACYEDLSPFSIPYEDLKNLKTEAAKLKLQGKMQLTDFEKLLKILSILSNDVRHGIGNALTWNCSGDLVDEENSLVKCALKNINIAAEASLISLLILTSANLDSRVYVEDVIEQIILFTTYEIRSTINPFFKSKDSKNKNCFSKIKSCRINKSIVSLSNKLSEILQLLSELLFFTKLNDNIVLNMSSLGVLSLFSCAQNLELSSFKLLVSVFSFYDKHRKYIFDDLLSFIVLHDNPLHPYKLHNGKSILLFTALSLQLIQSSINFLGERTATDAFSDGNFILEKWKTTESVSYNFLYDFMIRITKAEKKVSRPLFENFLSDLSLLIKNPEWPAAELFLQVIANLAVTNFLKEGDTSLRVLSLECLCNISFLIKKNKVSELTLEVIERLMKNHEKSNSEASKENESLERIKKQDFVRRTLLETSEIRKSNLSGLNAAQFYLVLWISRNHEKINSLKKTCSEITNNSCQDIELQIKELINANAFLKNKLLQHYENREEQLPPLTNLHDDDFAEIVNYLYFEGTFNNNFSLYFSCIIKALMENPVVLRTKALKGLANIIELESSFLGRFEIQLAVLNSLLDHSPLVRESALDLIGKFIISKPEFIPSYYSSLMARSLDTSISVRKKVLKILMDIIWNFPELKQISEIHLKVLRRINDEESSIQDLVVNFFQKLWFTPVEDKPKLNYDKLVKKVVTIIDLIALAKEESISFLEMFFDKLFKSDSNVIINPRIPNKEIPDDLGASSKQIIDCLMETVIQLEKLSQDSAKLTSCGVLINLFSKYQPEQLIPYATNLEPYLLLKCKSREDYTFVSCVAQTLGVIIPLIKHPSQLLLVQLEENLIKLIMQCDSTVITSSVSCLAHILLLTKHYKLLRDCFHFYYDFIIKSKEVMASNTNSTPLFSEIKPSLNRSIFVVGLLVQYFNFNDPEIGNNSFSENFKFVVSENVMYFSVRDIDTQLCILKAIGSICARYSDLLMENNIRQMYVQSLKGKQVSIPIKQQILNNIETFLMDEDLKFSMENEGQLTSQKNKIKELQDLRLGMASTIIQAYLDSIFECLFHNHYAIRNGALKLIRIILSQGLIYPLQIVPYLICMCTDENEKVRNMAEGRLLEIERKYPGYSYMKALVGISLSYHLQKSLKPKNITRGYRLHESIKYPVALNSLLFHLLKTKQQKRSFLLSLVRYFDENSKLSSNEMLFIADNLAHFPYKVLDEPMYIIHQIDIILSVSGSNMLQIFRENLLPGNVGLSTEEAGSTDEEERSEDEEGLLSRLPQDLTPLQQAMKAARGCLLLGKLKMHLIRAYSISFKKIQEYSPVDVNKTYEKNISNPLELIHFASNDRVIDRFYLDEWDKLDGSSLIKNYKEIKKLTNSLGTEEIHKSSPQKNSSAPEEIVKKKTSSSSPLNAFSTQEIGKKINISSSPLCVLGTEEMGQKTKNSLSSVSIIGTEEIREKKKSSLCSPMNTLGTKEIEKKQEIPSSSAQSSLVTEKIQKKRSSPLSALYVKNRRSHGALGPEKMGKKKKSSSNSQSAIGTEEMGKKKKSSSNSLSAIGTEEMRKKRKRSSSSLSTVGTEEMGKKRKRSSSSLSALATDGRNKEN